MEKPYRNNTYISASPHRIGSRYIICRFAPDDISFTTDDEGVKSMRYTILIRSIRQSNYL
jgi:hypothetical protein